MSGMGIWILGFGLTTYIGAPLPDHWAWIEFRPIFGLSPFFFHRHHIGRRHLVRALQTSLGLRIRSVGENPAVAEVSGINVTKTRYLCVVRRACLWVLPAQFTPWITIRSGATISCMGWGFIALALVFFSMWNPFILLGGSILFGTLWQLSLNPELVLPGVLSRYIWRMVPFAITLGALILMATKWFRAKWGAAKPEALGQPYLKD